MFWVYNPSSVWKKTVVVVVVCFFNPLLTIFIIKSIPPILNVILLVVKLTKRPFPSCLEPHSESKAKCKAFRIKISFVCT